MDTYKFKFEGRDFRFDIPAITANEWRIVRHYCGHNPLDLFQAVGTSEIEAVEALFWLVMRQNSEPAFDPGQRQFGLFEFMESWADAEAKAQAKSLAEAKAKESEGPKARKRSSSAERSETD